MRKITFIFLLFMSCLTVWPNTHYEYNASSEDPTMGMEIDFNDEVATVKLYSTNAFANNFYWPGNVNALTEWDDIKYISFVSEDGAEYSASDWEDIQNLFHKYDNGELSLDCSSMVINDENFHLATRSINYVKMPNGLVNLANRAFEDCAYLSAIGWSPALESIGDEAFLGTAFDSFNVPEGVKNIGDGAFSFCPNLTTISLPTTLQTIGVDPLDGSVNVISIHSHRLTAPTAEGDICDNTGWNLSVGEFAFYGKCILYIQPDQDTFNSYLNSPYWCKFFLAGKAKICLHTYDTNRPLVEGVQELTVDQQNVAPEVDLEGFTRTFHVNTVYNRDMVNVKWYTIMLPFDVNYNTIMNVFGEGTQVMGYSGIHDYTLCFEEPKTTMKANVPYLIKPGETKSEYEFDGEDVNYTKILPKTEFSVVGENSSYNQYESEFVGTYCNQKIPVDAYYLKNNKFYYMPSENTTKGWKAYGAVVMIQEANGGNVSIRWDDLDSNIEANYATKIDDISKDNIYNDINNGIIYNLAGQQVISPSRGIYIMNGKKIFIR